MLGKFSVKKPYTVLVAVVLVIVLGVVSFTKMTADLLPSISLPYVIVMTSYPGASPETVEMVVTKPVESSMATVSNIENISSVSSENYSMVVLEFAQSTDMNSVSLEIRENLDQIKSYWSDSIGNPIIMKLNPDMLPVMIAAVGGEGMNAAEVTALTQDTIVPELESIEGVASASATGLLEESVNVIIQQDKIDAINEQIFGSIDDEMKEAGDELAKSRQEVYDGQAELKDAEADLNESAAELEENKQKLEDSRKEIADGKAEIAENKSKLENGKTELASKKEATTKQLAEAETKIVTAKADLEATKMHITANMTTIKAAQDGLTQAQTGLDAIVQSAAAMGASQPGDIENMIKAMPGLSTLETQKTESAALENALSASQVSDGDRNLHTDEVSQLTAKGITTLTESNFLSEAISALQIQIVALDAQINQIEQLITLKTNWETTQTMVNNLEDSLNANTMGLGANAYLAQLQSTLTTVEDNISKLDSAMNELYAGNLTAAIEFANAQTTISLGELQIATAQTQLEAGEEQLKAGQEQLEAGEEQISSGREQLADSAEQLSDALKQIQDGEEDLEEARKNAYEKADMNGILTVETVKSLLAAQNFSMPAGYVTEEGISYLIRVGDKPDDIGKLKQMPILNPEMDGVDVITLGDVADVFMTDNSGDIYANVNGAPGIMISIQKQTGYSTGDVSDKILDKFEQLKAEEAGLMLVPLMDQGIYIDLVMDSILNNVLFGAILAILILLLFLKDIRPTAVIACSIPISLITAIVCMYFSGVTLNVISLSGLALGIGMLVDNSIVVIENIYRMRKEGMPAKEAAINGTAEVAGAIMASTLTTVCVFLPIVFTEGITRQLFVDMGLTIAYSLLASLLIALTVVPAMASGVLVRVKEKPEGKLFGGLTKIYEKILSLSLKVKPVVLLAVVILLAGSAAAAFAKGTAFMPEMDSTQMTMSVSLPEDTPLSETSKVTDEMVERLMGMEDVADVGAMASTSTMTALTGGGNAATNATDLYISLKNDKKRTNKELAADITEMMADICEKNDAEISIETSNMDMSALTGSGISIQIKGRDLDILQELSKEVAAIVETVEGTQNVSDGLEEATGELKILIDRDKAIEHGLTVAEVFQQISAKLAGASSSTTLVTELKEYDVYVKHAKDMALTRELVKELTINRTKQDGTKEEIPLNDIAVFENTVSPKSVNRNNQDRYMEVSAEIADGYNVGLVSEELERQMADFKLPSGYTMEFTGENEMITDAMNQMYLMLLLAVIFMYLIMVAQFQSLLSPFIIMFTIPLAFTGGFLGLIISGSEVSVIALIGFVMLSGVIVNNGIVLVDYINQLRSEGMEKHDAILLAGRTRLRPVLMTALTTILALCTMVFGKDMGAEMSRPMAVVVIGGLTYGTLLTLVVIPCIYDIFSGKKKIKEKRRHWKKNIQRDEKQMVTGGTEDGEG